MQVILNETTILDFATMGNAQKFLEDERAKWPWLAKLPDQLKKGGSELTNLLLDGPVIKALNLEGTQRDELHLGSVHLPFITEDSEEGIFIKDVTRNYDYVVAYFCLVFMDDRIRHIAYNNKVVSETLRMGTYEYEKVTAMTLSLSLGNYESFLGARRQSEFQKILDDQRAEQNAFKAHSQVLLDSFRNKTLNETNQILSANGRVRAALNRRVKALRVLSKRGAESARSAVEESKSLYLSAVERLKAADDAYTEQLDLKHSVNYWRSRKWSHGFAKYGWLCAVIFSLALMLGSVGLYFASGGLTNISPKIIDQKYLSASSGPSTSAQQTVQGGVDSTFTKAEVVSIATNLTGAILLITLVSILIRIALRQFSIHTQYALEAGERVTFIKTYLALMQEKQIKADEDRKLILECIFKSSAGNSTPEIAFSLPIDALTKAFGERKP